MPKRPTVRKIGGANGDVIGFPWFRREHYATLRVLLEDGDELPRAYAEWLKEAEAARQSLARYGAHVIRAYIDPLEFSEWCLSRALKFDAAARAQYADWIAVNGAFRKQG